MKIKFVNLSRQYIEDQDKILSAINKVSIKGDFVLGESLKNFENKFSSFCNTKYSLGLNSGSDALFLYLKSLDLSKDDEIILPSLSFIATAWAAGNTGAKIVFCDVGNDMNIDANKIENLITKKTKVIIPVHLTGRVCNMNIIIKICKKYKIKLLEDSAQAFGSIYREKAAGSFGYVGCFSMNPMKNLAACGEAGAIVTDDLALYQRIVALRYNGTVNKEFCIQPSLNGRLDSLQAGILLERMKDVSKKIKKVRSNAYLYNQLLNKSIIPAPERKDEKIAFYSYTIQVEKREELMEFLSSEGIETKVQHLILMCEQKPYLNCPKDNIQNAKRIVKKILSIPVNETITKDQIHYVSESIAKFYKKC